MSISNILFRLPSIWGFMLVVYYDCIYLSMTLSSWSWSLLEFSSSPESSFEPIYVFGTIAFRALVIWSPDIDSVCFDKASYSAFSCCFLSSSASSLSRIARSTGRLSLLYLSFSITLLLASLEMTGRAPKSLILWFWIDILTLICEFFDMTSSAGCERRFL